MRDRSQWLRAAAVVLSAIVLSGVIFAVAQHSATAPGDDKPSVDHGAGSMGGHGANRADHSADHGQKKDESAADYADGHYYEPLPQETDEAGLKLELRKLATTGRLMQVVAHPDDEDGGMLTLEARGKGVDTLLMTLTRGEGGQNKLGSNLFDELGVLRTLELLAADRYYGVEQRFSRVADFGYSKTAEETFQKWHGHDVALGDIVRVIREFRPDVLVARFSGTDRDGHGHHQASAILTREAFRAAADPAKFPEQIAAGLQPWQAKKLYIGNVCGFGASSCDADKYTVKLNTGKPDAVLGMSYAQFAMKGLRHQQSQGLGAISIPDGDRFAFYKLVDSVVDSPKDKDGHEADFFDGIDTSLLGLAARLGDEEKKVPWLRGKLKEIQGKIAEAQETSESSVASTALTEAGTLTVPIFHEVVADLSDQEKKTFPWHVLQQTVSEISKARVLASGAQLSAEVVAPVGATSEEAFMAVPGEPFDVAVRLTFPWGIDKGSDVGLTLPAGWKSEELKREQSDKELIVRFRVDVPANARLTRPYWHRSDPERDSLNIVDDPEFQTLALSPPPVKAYGTFAKMQIANIACMVRYKDSARVVSERPLAVAPAFSMLLDPSEQVIATEDGPSLEGKAEIASNVRAKDQSALKGRFKMEAPEGWQPEPPITWVNFEAQKRERDVDFKIVPGGRKEGHAEVSGRFVEGEQRNGEHSFKEGYSVVTRDDLGTFYYYQPAVQRVSIVEVKVPHDLRVGYVMGAGDEIPTVLKQIGMSIELIPAEKLATEDLSNYQTIVLGIRAYEKQDVIANNKRLLDYVRGGGRLVVQYNTMGSFGVPIDFNGGKYTPYPTTLGRARVSVEEAPVRILEPANDIFHYPNEIAQKDFDGWVQERGLYFMSSWGPEFTPLLESHDPGEAEQKGGLLVAKYGKGTYIYCAYDFFRQLPAGVPGAVRLFVNMVSGR